MLEPGLLGARKTLLMHGQGGELVRIGEKEGPEDWNGQKKKGQSCWFSPCFRQDVLLAPPGMGYISEVKDNPCVAHSSFFFSRENK